MPYFTDHEVAVTLKDAGATATGRKVTITATSLEHEITKVIVWGKHGGNKKPLQTYTAPPNTEKKFKDTHGTEITKAHQVVQGDEYANDDFPICIDVYESSVDGGERADVHRHGWFGTDMEPKAAKDHPVKEPDAEHQKPFYPTFAEEPAPAKGDLNGPPPYEAPPPAKKK
jgi:hypothetical protein